jgi:hypothetical protein
VEHQFRGELVAGWSAGKSWNSFGFYLPRLGSRRQAPALRIVHG